MRQRNGRTRPPVTAEVAALRQRVWRTRLALILTAAAVVASASAYWDLRSRPMRMPSVALSDGSPVFAAAEAYLITQSAQLSLKMAITDFARGGVPGMISPMSASRQGNTTRFWVQLSGFGTVSENGAPVVGPVQASIRSHTLDRGGRVSQIVVECVYETCWDRKVTSGRTLGPDEAMPTGGELLDGYLQRYSYLELVTDHLVFKFMPCRARWEITSVQRLSSVSR